MLLLNTVEQYANAVGIKEIEFRMFMRSWQKQNFAWDSITEWSKTNYAFFQISKEGEIESWQEMMLQIFSCL